MPNCMHFHFRVFISLKSDAKWREYLVLTQLGEMQVFSFHGSICSVTPGYVWVLTPFSLTGKNLMACCSTKSYIAAVYIDNRTQPGAKEQNR